MLKLRKALYGLKQSSLVWNLKLDKALKNIGLKQSTADPCVYFYINEENISYLAIYVDDILIFSNDTQFRKELKEKLMKEFKMKFLGKAKQCLGIRITREENLIYLDQEDYIRKILAKFNMQDCNSAKTPLDPNQKLAKGSTTLSEIELEELKTIPYQQAIGSLLFAAQCTRPDISMAVNMLSRFNKDPRKEHWSAVKRVFRYLKGTLSTRLCYRKETNIDFLAYSDADWANDVNERKSTTGYVTLFQGGAISWSSKRQPTVALSSTEAEYMALSAVTQEVIWLRSLSEEINPSNKKEATVIYCDNRSAIDLASTSSFHPRSKHIDVRHHFIRDKISQNEIRISSVSTNDMIADSLTKAVFLKNICIVQNLLVWISKYNLSRGVEVNRFTCAIYTLRNKFIYL